MRSTTPGIVRNWFAPMLVVVAVAFVCTSLLYTLDSVILTGEVVSVPAVLEHYFAFTPELITDALPALGMTVVATLGIVLTVIAIIVQLSSERYTGVALMFLRDPTHIAVLSFYIIVSLCAVWLSVSLRVDFVPRGLLLMVMALTSIGLASMLPYFAYTFWFLEPSNIIERLRLRSSRLGDMGLAARSAAEVEPLQGKLFHQLEEITDIANNSIEGRDKIIAVDAVDALRDFAISYIADKPEPGHVWYRIGDRLRAKPEFIGMDPQLMQSLDSRDLWVEWKTLREYTSIYREALDSMHEVNSLIAINTRFIAEVAAGAGKPGVVHMVFRFMNSFLERGIEARAAAVCFDVLNQYRMLLEFLLSRGEDGLAYEGLEFLKYYSHIAFEDELPDVAETAAYDVVMLCRYAHEHRLKGMDRILKLLLEVDANSDLGSLRQFRSLLGVRCAQARLAVYFLSVGETSKAKMIADDMEALPLDMCRRIREDLMLDPTHFWETVDRGRNRHYLAEAERAQVDIFLEWLECPRRSPTPATSSQRPGAPARDASGGGECTT
jgi:hypothetical protein